MSTSVRRGMDRPSRSSATVPPRHGFSTVKKRSGPRPVSIHHPPPPSSISMLTRFLDLHLRGSCEGKRDRLAERVC